MSQPFNTRELAEFAHGYLHTALWASTGDDDEPLDSAYSVDDYAPEALLKAQQECSAFITANLADLREYMQRMGGSNDFTPAGRAGHDFWLTRNHHGAGFWDRDLGELGDRLTTAAQTHGEITPYVGDDGKVYL